MKDKSWIIILIMAIALTISIAYSIFLNQKVRSPGESTVTTTSIIEMTATTATIKNTLKGTGTIEYNDEPKKNETESTNQTQDSTKTNDIAENVENTRK